MPHFRLTSPAEFTVQFACKVCSSSGAQIFGAQIVHTKEFGGRLPLSSTKCFVLFCFFLIIPLPFLFYLNSFISLLPRRLCNSRTKVGSCLLFIHSILSTNQCKAGGEGGGGGRAWGGDLTFFKNLPSNSLPSGKSFQSNAIKFPHPWLHIVIKYPKARPKKGTLKTSANKTLQSLFIYVSA